MRTPLLAAAFAAIAAVALPAHAGTVAIQPDVDYSRLSWVNLSFDGGQNFQGELAGQLRLKRTGGTDTSVKAANDFLTFCVEPTEWLANSTLNVGALSTGDTALGGMGVSKARAIARLIDAVLPNIGQSVSNAEGAAIQIDLWEIVRETGTHYSLTDGSFRVSAAADVMALATGYLDYANGHGPQLYNLRALTANGAQDQLGQVPEPGAIALLGLGLAAVCTRLRHRIRATA